MSNTDSTLINKLITKTLSEQIKWLCLSSTPSEKLPIPLAFENTEVDLTKSYRAVVKELTFYLAYINRTSLKDGSVFIGYELLACYGNEFHIVDVEQPYLYELQTNIEFVNNRHSSIAKKINEFIDG